VSAVQALIETAKAKTKGKAFPPKVVEDLKACLRANDRETSWTRRVSRDAFCEYARKEHRFVLAVATLERYVRRVLGRRSWGAKCAAWASWWTAPRAPVRSRPRRTSAP
jgi:hypothetical protein